MLKMVDGTGIIGVDMVCPLGGVVSPPQPPNYDKVEMEGVGSLMLPNSLKAPLERLELLGNSVQGENPAPDNLQEIKSAGRKSKNLFDITKLKKGAGANYPTEIELVGETLIAKKDGGTANQMTFEIELENLEPNTTYEFTTKQTICKRKDSDTEKAGTIFSFKAYKNESQIENKGNVFTTGESESDIYKIIFSVIAGDFGSLEYVKFEQPMLSHIKGAAYEPYSDKCLFDVQVTGKNQLSNNPNDWQIGKGISWSAYPNDAIIIYSVINRAVNVINLKSSNAYSFVNNSGEIVIKRMVERDSNGKGIKDHNIRSNKYTFVTNQNTSNIILQVEKIDGTELLSSDIESIKIMLVEGEVNEPTIYEPYTEQTMQIALDEPLRGIGEYNDVLTKDGVVMKVKRVVLDGSEDEEWRLDRRFENHINFALVIKGAITVNTGIRTMMDKFKYVRSIWNNDSPGQDMFDAKLRINMPKTLATDLQTFKTWLSQNPLTVDYVLAEPVTEPLPESVQAQLQALHSENGVTHVFVDSGEVPCGIKLTYRKEI